MWSRPRTKPRRTRAHLAPNYFLESSREGYASQSLAAGADPRDGNSEASLLLPPGRSHSSTTNTGRFHALKLRKKSLAIALLLSGMVQIPGGHASITTVEAQGHSIHARDIGASEKVGWSSVTVRT